MTPIIDAWLVLVAALAARLNREQSKALEYLFAANKQRRLQAAKAKELGRAAVPSS